MADQTQTAETLRSLLSDPDIPEESKGQIRRQLAMWGEPEAAPAPGSGPTTQAAVRRFLKQSGDPETPVGAAVEQTGQAAREQRGLFQLPPGAVVNERRQEVGLLDRAFIKNIIDNPEIGARWLRAKGWEAYSYQPGEGGTTTGLLGLLPDAVSSRLRSKVRIAVRKPGDEEFTVVDPSGLDAQDFLDFWGDMLSSAIIGTASTEGMHAGAAAGALAGLPSGPGELVAIGGGALAGGAIAGGLAGAGVETGRQFLGSGIAKAAGQPDPYAEGLSTPDIAGQAVAGAAMGPLGELLGLAGRGTRPLVKGATNTFKTVAGGMISKLVKVSAQALAWAGRNGDILFGPKRPMGAYQLGQATLDFLTNPAENRTIESALAQDLLAKSGSGAVRLKPILEAVREMAQPPIEVVAKTPQAPGKYGMAAAPIDAIRGHLVSEAAKMAKNAGGDSIEDAIHRDLTLPVSQAQTLRSVYNKAADYAIDSVTKEKDPAIAEASKRLGRLLSGGIRMTLPGPLQGEYAAYMERIAAKINVAQRLDSAIRTGEIVKGQEETPALIHAGNRAEAFFRTLLNPGAREADKNLVDEFGALWRSELGMAGLDQFGGRARAASALANLRAEELGIFTGQPPGVGIQMPGLSFGGLPLGPTAGGLVGGLVGAPFGPRAAGVLAGMGAMAGGYSATPIGAVRSMQATNAIASGINSLFGATTRRAIPFGGKVAASATAAATVHHRQAAAKETATENVDQQTIDDLKAMQGDIVKGMMTNPNITADTAAEEFQRRMMAYLAKKKLALTAPVPGGVR
jgi:hypothetical protein